MDSGVRGIWIDKLRFSICYFGAARDNYELRNENYGFCSIYGEAYDATGVVLGKDAKKVFDTTN